MSYAQPRRDSSRQLIGFAVVVTFHAAMGYALVTGLARKIVEVVRQPIETNIIEEVKPPPPDKPPPPPPPRMVAPPPPYIPPPEVQVQLPQTPQAAISVITTVKPAAPVPPPGQRAAPPAPPAPPAQRTPLRTPPVVQAKACEKPEYPSASLRAQETGIVLLAFLIDVNGSVLESKVERSSGFRRLDGAALSALALCKFSPATVDGKPERAWAKLEYEWKIE